MENEMESMPAIGDCKGAEDKFVKDGLLAARLLVSDHVVSRLDKVDLFFNSIKPHGSLINTDKDICQDDVPNTSPGKLPTRRDLLS